MDVLADMLERVKAGDIEAFTGLVRPLQAELRAYLARVLPFPQDTDDVAQEVLIEAFHGISGYKPERGEFVVWLKGIARNRARKAWRRVVKERLNISATALALRQRVAERYMAREDAHQDLVEVLRKCLNRLPQHQRAVVEDYYRRHRTADEVAAAHNMSAGAVYTLLTRVRRALRECIEQSLGMQGTG